MAAGNTIVTSQANVPSLQTGATALAANPNRCGLLVQNQGTNPVYILLGSGASSTVFHVALRGGSSLADGSGATFALTSGTVYQGIVTAGGTGAVYTALEF